MTLREQQLGAERSGFRSGRGYARIESMTHPTPPLRSGLAACVALYLIRGAQNAPIAAHRRENRHAGSVFPQWPVELEGPGYPHFSTVPKPGTNPLLWSPPILIARASIEDPETARFLEDRSSSDGRGAAELLPNQLTYRAEKKPVVCGTGTLSQGPEQPRRGSLLVARIEIAADRDRADSCSALHASHVNLRVAAGCWNWGARLSEVGGDPLADV